MEERIRQSRNWIARMGDTAHARVWLAVLSFTESSIFVVPPDPLLAALVFASERRWIRDTVLTIVTSVIGAVFGYIVGSVLFDTVGAWIVAFYELERHMEVATRLINESVFVFTLTTAITPIPFKAAVLSAGFVKANFIPFIVAVIVGRTARYFFVAYVAKVFGVYAEHIIKRSWFYATIVGAVILLAYAVYILLI